MSDRFDIGSAALRALDDLAEAASAAGDIDLGHLVLGCVVATVSGIGDFTTT